MPEPSLHIADPNIPPPGGMNWPFEFLSGKLDGITLSAASTARQIKDLYELPFGTGVREAWDEIRKLERRALVEFLMHEVPVPPAGAVAPSPEQWEQLLAEETGAEPADEAEPTPRLDFGDLSLPIDYLLPP